MARFVLVKNSGVPPATCTPWSMLPWALISLPYSHSSGPTCFASGKASRSCSAWARVIFLRACTSGGSWPMLKFGHFWIWNTSAPSCPMVRLKERCSPSSRAIMATTVKTPITMPSRVRNERSLWPESVASARRRSSVRACRPRAIHSRHAGRNGAGGAAGSTASLIAQRLDRVQEGGAQRRPDADAADDGGDDADQGAHDVERLRHFVEPLQQLVLPVDREIVLLVRPQPARVAHDRDHLVLGLRHLARGSDHREHQASLEPERPGERGERDEHAHILRLAE